jgi:hypothetical protein
MVGSRKTRQFCARDQNAGVDPSNLDLFSLYEVVKAADTDRESLSRRLAVVEKSEIRVRASLKKGIVCAEPRQLSVRNQYARANPSRAISLCATL